jgi:hypothetical protein
LNLIILEYISCKDTDIQLSIEEGERLGRLAQMNFPGVIARFDGADLQNCVKLSPLSLYNKHKA